MNREIIINRKRQRQKSKYDRIRSREKDGNGIINTKVFKTTA